MFDDRPLPQPPRPHVGRPGSGRGSPYESEVPRFDIKGLVRRARRQARLSQRELARQIGVGKSTIARAESDDPSVSLPVLLAALAAGGIDLIAVDRDGEVATMRPDALRDRGHRKLPAHLNAWVASASEMMPDYWRGSAEHNAPVRYAHRNPWDAAEYLPIDHPGPEEIALVRERDALDKEFRWLRTFYCRFPGRRPPRTPGRTATGRAITDSTVPGRAGPVRAGPVRAGPTSGIAADGESS